MASYTEQVRAMVRKLRLEDDKLTRLALADLLEEAGRPGAVNRTAVHLRAGHMVLATVDVAALCQLCQVCRKLIADGEDVTEWAPVQRIVSGVHDPMRVSVVVNPSDYVAMWQFAIAYADDMGSVVAEEVRALLQAGHQDTGGAEPEREVGSSSDSQGRDADWRNSCAWSSTVP